MFEQHTVLTRIAYWLIALNSLLGLISVGLLVSQGGLASTTGFFIISLILVLLLNAYLAWCIYRRSRRALVASLVLYAIQLIGFTTASSSFSVTLGPGFQISWPFAGGVLSVNLLAALLFIAILLAYLSVKKRATLHAEPQ